MDNYIIGLNPSESQASVGTWNFDEGEGGLECICINSSLGYISGEYLSPQLVRI